jgi:UDP-glucose 4-epimerase
LSKPEQVALIANEMSDWKKSVVVVGGGGYIGFHIGLTLLRQGKGQKVTLFDLHAPDPEWFPEGEEHSPLPFIQGSVLSLPQLTQAFLKVKANSVVHCGNYIFCALLLL